MLKNWTLPVNNHLCQQGNGKTKYGINHAYVLTIPLGFNPLLESLSQDKGRLVRASLLLLKVEGVGIFDQNCSAAGKREVGDFTGAV